MPLTIKMENEQAVLQDGKPVYVTEDGQDFVADVPSMHANILKFKGDEKASRKTIKDLNGKLLPFADIDDLPTWFETVAAPAIETIKNLDDKTLVDAGKVEQVKAEVKQSYEAQITQFKDTIRTTGEGHVVALAGKDRVIHKLTIGNEFANDPHFNGAEKLTNLFPDLGQSYYGHRFKVQPVEDKPDEVMVVGYYLNGNEILSRKPETTGEIAKFNEAISIIISEDPRKEEILTAGHAGSGAGGGGGGGGGGGKTEIEDLEKEHAELMKAGKGREALAVKNRLFKARQAAKAAGRA